ncbi:transglutaminase domain-containing protein, partial [Sphingomonas sp.]|uniref:transglutaminase domain-containing protein n=1 Tax=Sphingomonas sp. TaxID=28214 RepID=UPI002DB6562C
LQPEGLRIGDVIDLAFSRTHRDPSMGGRSELLLGPQDGVAYGRNRIRVLWPSSKKIDWRARPGVIDPRLDSSGQTHELVSDLSNVTSSRPPEGAPSRYRVVNAVELSEFPDWASVSRAFEPLYAKAGAIASDSPLRAEIARIAAASKDPKVRAQQALILVQDKVRYLFLGMNGGGYVPASAELTWSRRFGDCKAKTVLLVAILRELGIDARPVLVNTQYGDFVADRLPVMGAFDHAIVEARIGGRSYWMDGTRFGDRRLDQLRTPSYAVGLPLVSGGAGLEPLMPEPLSEPTETTSLALDASAGIDVPAPANAEMRFRGQTAVDMRVKYSGLSAADRDAELRKLWRQTYDFVSPTAIATRDDPATGDFLITMTGTARMDWAADVGTRWYEVDRARLGWKIDVTRDGVINKDAPFAFDYPDWWQSRETIKLPYAGAGFRLQGGAVDQTVGGLYAFHRSVKIDGGTVTMESDTRALAAELPAAQAEATRAKMLELAQTGVYVRVPEDYLPTDGDIAALKDDKPALAKAYLARSAVLFDRGDVAASLTNADAALAIDPDLPTANSIRALALANRGDASAVAAADRALAKDANQALAWRAKGVLALNTGRFADAETAFTKNLGILNGDDRAYVGRGTARVALGRFADGLADLDAALRLNADLPVQSIRAAALLGLGRREEALAAADRGVTANPDDPRVRTIRVQVRSALGMREEARADLDLLIGKEPKAAYYISRAALWPDTERAKRLADLDAALRLDPRSVAALQVRAADAIEHRAFERAQADIAAVERIDPNAQALAALKTSLLAKQGKPQEALRVADAEVAKHPADARVLNERCWLKATLNVSADTALADCDSALKLAPDSAAILDSRAFAKLRMGALDGALADYDAALRIVPDLPASLYGRALVKARRGDRTGALTDLAAARKLAPAIDARFADFGMPAPDAAVPAR